MSVLDQFRSVEQRVAERLRELKPLVEEYRELEQVAQRLGLELKEDSTAGDERPPASVGGTRRRRRDSKTKPRSAASRRQRSGVAAAAKSAATTQGGGARASRRSPEGSGDGSNRASGRRAEVLRLVTERPGITVRQIAKELGVDPTGLYRPVHKLEQGGAISKQGAALRPAGR